MLGECCHCIQLEHHVSSNGTRVTNINIKSVCNYTVSEFVVFSGLSQSEQQGHVQLSLLKICPTLLKPPKCDNPELGPGSRAVCYLLCVGLQRVDADSPGLQTLHSIQSVFDSM